MLRIATIVATIIVLGQAPAFAQGAGGTAWPPGQTPPPSAGPGLYIDRPGELPRTLHPLGDGYLATRPGMPPKRCTPLGNGRLACG